MMRGIAQITAGASEKGTETNGWKMEFDVGEQLRDYLRTKEPFLVPSIVGNKRRKIFVVWTHVSDDYIDSCIAKRRKKLLVDIYNLRARQF